MRSIDHETKLLSRYSGKITVHTTGYRTVIFDGLDKEDIQDFAELIRTCISNQAYRKPIEHIKTQIENKIREVCPHDWLQPSGLVNLALLLSFNEGEERVERVARCFSRFLIATNVRLAEIDTYIQQEITYDQIRSIKYETEYPKAGITLLTINDETVFFDLDVIQDSVSGTQDSQRLAEYVEACVYKEKAAKEWRELFTTTLTAAFSKLRGKKYNPEEVTDAAFRGTSGEIMRKYGLSEQEMKEIVRKWSSSLHIQSRE